MNRGNAAVILIAVCLAISISALAGTTGSISGKVVDASGQPVVGAWVVVVETNVSAYTDSTGTFAIPVANAGSYHLVVVHKDFGTVKDLPEMTVRVGANSKTDVTLQLSQPTDNSHDAVKKVEADRDKVLGAVRHDLAIQLQRTDKEAGEGKVQTSEHQHFNMPSTVSPPSKSFAPTLPERVRRTLQPPAPDCIMPRRPVPDEISLPPVDMYFKDYGTNGFVSTRFDRFSTFALDVDDASYTLVRRYLLEGNMPPTDAIRVEEFINHFNYGYNNPTDNKFRIFTELTDSPFDAHTVILKIGIKGRDISRDNRRPMNLTLVVDVSGSMNYGNRIQVVKDALKLLVKQLGSTDRVGIVAYNTYSRVIIDPTPASDRSALRRAIDGLFCNGSTNAEAGLTMGYEMANRQYEPDHNNLVVLISDGVANAGNTGADGIMRRINRFAHKGITLSTFGVGMGNYNDVLLEQLAQQGNGRYAYINSFDEARRDMVDNFVANTQVLGRDAKVQVEFDPSQVRAYRLIGYENRDVPDYRFRDNNQDGGEIGAGHEVTALYEVKLTDARRATKIADVYVRWTNFDESQVTEARREVDMRKDFQRAGSVRPELRLAVVASRFAEKLKQTPFAGSTSYDDLLSEASDLQRDWSTVETRELAQLITRARDINLYHAVREQYEVEADRQLVDDNYKR